MMTVSEIYNRQHYYFYEWNTLAIEAGFTSSYHMVEEEGDDYKQTSVEKCVSSIGQTEKPIKVCINFTSDSAKGKLQ